MDNTRGGPGKCAPRFIEDLMRHDPTNPAATHGRNVLTEPPTKLADGGLRLISISDGACQHRYVTKEDQSILPGSGSRPDSTSEYRVASLCSKCRCHMTLSIKFNNGGHSDLVCPTEHHPLHHLRCDPSASHHRPKPTDIPEHFQWEERHRFVCTSPGCSAVVSFSFRPPRLGAQYLTLLTDPSNIKERAEKAEKPIPDLAAVLRDVRLYLRDALNQTRTHLAAKNTRFKTALGEPCRPLLEYLGFRYHDDPGEKAKWFLPQVRRSSEKPLFQDAQTVMVDDVKMELTVLLDGRPDSEKENAQINSVNLPIILSKIQFGQCLSCVDYPKTKAGRENVDLVRKEDNPYFVGLGAVEAFSDGLVVYAYERQKECDPDHAPFYLSWLKEVTNLRESELLQTKVALMESSGEISYNDINQAYQYFQADPTWDDATIIGHFKSRLADAPRQEAEARQHLRAIGVVRQSDIILATASNRITTYHDALAWLGAEESTPDEFVITLFTMKAEENKAETASGREAVRLIAEKRDSNALRDWLSTGQLGEIELDENQAYTRLGIEDRSLDDDTILTTFEILSGEAPSQVGELRAALKTIAKARQSQRLGYFLQIDTSPQEPTWNWPVGLENIGNTCYLNSLLQYYFAVKTFRDVILNFSAYEMPMNPEALAIKRVGSRKVSVKEVERAKKFALALQKLFITLFTADTKSIEPEKELARLTLIKSSDEEDFRRKSIASSQGRPNLGEINGVPVQGPALPQELPDSMDIDTTMQEVQPHDNKSKDATLVNKQLLDEAADAIMRDNGDSMELESDHQPVLDEGNSVSDDKENQIESSDVVMINGVTSTNSEENRQPPDRAPPIPPRSVDELELGAQQDVTEVIGNVVFQLECAIRPTRYDSRAEQYDEIKDLFYGKQRTHLIDNEGERALPDQYFSDIKVDVASGPRDIYDALDGAFDAQEVTSKDGPSVQYVSIVRAPPIFQIHVQRVQFDTKNKTAYKSNAHLHLRKEIYLDRYLTCKHAAMIPKRRETWRWKEELKQLEEKKMQLLQTEAGISVPDVLGLTNDWIEVTKLADVIEIIEDDTYTTMELEQCAEHAKKDIEEINSSMRELRSKLENQFNDYHHTAEYCLAAVFMHRGEDFIVLTSFEAPQRRLILQTQGNATFGHYWVYIYDFDLGIWRKYNDGYVTEVTDEREIFGDESDQNNRFNQPATPYYVVYAKSSARKTLIQPVFRAVPSKNNSTMKNPRGGEQHQMNNNWDEGIGEDEVMESIEVQEHGVVGDDMSGEKNFWYPAGTDNVGRSNYGVDDDGETQTFNADGW
ncbi:MAG: ubiquitin-specific protease ubp2 [Peltula sp. TS41687]|nr:MAG: ubiquitin-specific protease ubp2 [Peltula sp. TS41687]